ncbi:hypothetical protein ACFL9U_13900, partial [Thermodesulfobacteriota bacterium]
MFNRVSRVLFLAPLAFGVFSLFCTVDSHGETATRILTQEVRYYSGTVLTAENRTTRVTLEAPVLQDNGTDVVVPAGTVVNWDMEPVDWYPAANAMKRRTLYPKDLEVYNGDENFLPYYLWPSQQLYQGSPSFDISEFNRKLFQHHRYFNRNRVREAWSSRVIMDDTTGQWVSIPSPDYVSYQNSIKSIENYFAYELTGPNLRNSNMVSHSGMKYTVDGFSNPPTLTLAGSVVDYYPTYAGIDVRVP